MGIAFKNPAYLFFLLCIAIPIIIHLFSFRKYKHVYFHNLQFIKEIQTEQNRTKSKLKELLILAARIGTIAFLVFSFAQPYIPADNQNNSNIQSIAIYIDNSLSTQAETTEGIVLEYEKNKAQQILDAYPEDSKFYLFTNTASPTEQIPKTKDEIRNAISEIKNSPNNISTADILKRMKTAIEDTKTASQYHIISDMQECTFNLTTDDIDSSSNVIFYPIENTIVNNISIDSCFFESQHHIHGQNEKLSVIITNNSDETYANFPIKLFLNDTLKSLASCTLKPHTSSTVRMEFNTESSGIIAGRIEIEDYPILYDNKYYFSYFIDKQISIIDIFEKTANPYIQALCKGKNHISITQQNIRNIDYSSLHTYQGIILDGLDKISGGLRDELIKMNKTGNTIICIPSENIDVTSYNSLLSVFKLPVFTTKDTLKTTIKTIDKRNPVFRNVLEQENTEGALPEIKMHYQSGASQNKAVLQLANAQSFLSQSTLGNSTFFLFASPLNKENGTFVSSPLFIGLYTMLLYTSFSDDIQTCIGKASNIYIPELNGNEAPHINNHKEGIDVIPLYRNDIQTGKTHINPMMQIQTAGNYTITQNGKTLRGISYNYDRKESQFTFVNKETIEKFTLDRKNIRVISPSNDITDTLKIQNDGTPLWRIMLLCAIICVLIEIIVILYYDRIITRISA